MDKRISLFIGLILILSIGGCANSVEVEKYKDFDMKVGQTAVVKGENLKITLLNITEDSRCAQDVQCVWAGRVKMDLNVMKDGKNVGDFSIALEPNAILAVRNIEGYSIKLMKVYPYLLQGKKIEMKDYIVTFRVS